MGQSGLLPTGGTQPRLFQQMEVYFAGQPTVAPFENVGVKSYQFIRRMKSISDEELIRLYVTSPDTRYMDMLYRRYWETVYGRCLWITGDGEYAQDLTQDIFLQLGGKLAGFRQEARFSTWLKTVATNYCLTQLGYQQRLQHQLVPITESKLEIAQEEGGVERAELAEWTDQQVAQALNQLSPLEQQMLKLKYQDELSVAEIGHLLRISPSAVKMRLLRSRDKFRHHYLAQGSGAIRTD